MSIDQTAQTEDRHGDARSGGIRGNVQSAARKRAGVRRRDRIAVFPQAGMRLGRIGRRLVAGAIGCVLFLALVAILRLNQHSITPPSDRLYTSTRYITSIAVGPSGEVWAGTLGGVLRRTGDGRWIKYTVQDGLPSNEALAVTLDDRGVLARCPSAAARWTGTRWVTEPSETQRAGDMRATSGTEPTETPRAAGAPAFSMTSKSRTMAAPPAAGTPALVVTAEATWHGDRYRATITGLYVQRGEGWSPVPLPPSPGTHITALLPHGDALWAALFGDRIWAYSGSTWHPAGLILPEGGTEITALAEANGSLRLGTRRAGLWAQRDGIWTQHVPIDEPIDHNCQAMALFRGSLVVSTLENGLGVKTEHGWGHVCAPTLSSNAPRQMVEFRGKLYLRHGSGKLDRWDGKVWERNIAADLPHRQVSALAADGDRLYAAQWGGWSEFDGSVWTHHFDLPELQGLPISALCSAGGRLWLGTQSRGLAEYDRDSGRIVRHDERRGLTDDWVTTLAPNGQTVAVGMFVGGLALRDLRSSGVMHGATLTEATDAAAWSTQPELRGENVTALEPDGEGGLFIATRTGVWRRSSSGLLRRIELLPGCREAEAQCLCRVTGGLWVGTRTGLYFHANRY